MSRAGPAARSTSPRRRRAPAPTSPSSTPRARRTPPARWTRASSRSSRPAYGNRPIADVASLTLDVANAAADAGCPDQARVLYRYVIDRYANADFTGFRQRAQVGLSQLGGP